MMGALATFRYGYLAVIIIHGKGDARWAGGTAILCGLVFLGLFVVYPLIRRKRERKWPTTLGKVVSLDAISRKDAYKLTQYQPQLVYEYSVDGIPYKSKWVIYAEHKRLPPERGTTYSWLIDLDAQLYLRAHYSLGQEAAERGARGRALQCIQLEAVIMDGRMVLLHFAPGGGILDSWLELGNATQCNLSLSQSPPKATLTDRLIA